ncbi:CDP-alcohol phosphatidyltransferase family protein [Prolixibacteraceae bacterium JC049]|nr:CDP-alcohol phosphatidyltransferase family protein [Prolixibacteraceae bacterium JC049]
MQKVIFIIIQIISISRAVSGLVFVTIALTDGYQTLASALYVYACFSDILDGFLARKYNCTSDGGQILDLFGDKYLTIASLLFAAFNEIPPLPITFIAFREIFLMAIRTLLSKQKFLIPTNRIFGGIFTFSIWCSTFLLLIFSQNMRMKEIISLIFWTISVVAIINLFIRIKNNWFIIINQFKYKSYKNTTDI